MNCECNSKTEVLETRLQHRFDLGPVVFRRRRCLSCGEIFKTYEVRLYEPGRVDFDDTEEETADST